MRVARGTVYTDDSLRPRPRSIPLELETVRVSQVSKLFAYPSAQMLSGTGLDAPEAIYQTEKVHPMLYSGPRQVQERR